MYLAQIGIHTQAFTIRIIEINPENAQTIVFSIQTFVSARGQTLITVLGCPNASVISEPKMDYQSLKWLNFVISSLNLWKRLVTTMFPVRLQANSNVPSLLVAISAGLDGVWRVPAASPGQGVARCESRRSLCSPGRCLRRACCVTGFSGQSSSASIRKRIVVSHLTCSLPLRTALRT